MNKDIFIRCIFCIPFIWCFSGLFLYADANKELALLTFVVFLFSIFNLGPKQILQQINERRITWLFITMSIIAIVGKLTNGYSSSELRVLLSLTLLSIITPKNSLQYLKKNLSSLSVLGCLVSFIYCYYEAITLGTPRPSWGINPIPYTTFTASVVIMCLWFSFHEHRKKNQILLCIASLIGASAILISQTRGTLLALILAFIYLIIFSSIKKDLIFKLLIPIIIIGFTFGYFNNNKIEQRYLQTKHEYTQIMNGNLNTSIGYRLQMWQAGYELSKSPTFLGLGSNHIEKKQELYEEGKISLGSVKWTHYHNQYITTFIKNGIIGFLLLLSLISIPIIYHKKLVNSRNADSHIGILALIVFLTASLTDIPFSQPVTLAFYGILMMIITLGDEATDID
ncbi:O-antigen ligase family protein [Aliivibrio sp. S4TY2]|uniref:O-antigen ligase family protein n=1 Tax=unclassified Aliivibrio TaxID=2645654 RepID=UPI002378CF7F|nr:MULTISPECIES: O-antigen ligase family protein [unclassified Aliivibrio]MDD9155996.1 O-antigen ligase family protein [Aliivibrio sp. S4TY2]MDD9159705.1 O-antigen ligase family protein [Aliivibrio sp. S4TY1]MDD9163705.1 O-antigen ligase family protein [Aliivibrio sp. S4MY2]MDD9167705.1 O-antigen ligase family protein [Aliivibrio sp. S4MY4]MDD9185631.1 O-antigen ligase family protein [Aliivibrio sp. S4MY3]